MSYRVDDTDMARPDRTRRDFLRNTSAALVAAGGAAAAGASISSQGTTAGKPPLTGPRWNG